MDNRRGFTLIELLVVIAIIGLLSSVVLASLNTARAKADDASRVSNLRQVQTALEMYASSNNGKYPISPGGAFMSTCASWNFSGTITQNNAIPGLVSTYIGQLPSDPQQNISANLCCYIYAGNGTDYKYLFLNCPTSYACYGTTAISSGLADVAGGRSTYACSVYSPGAATW